MASYFKVLTVEGLQAVIRLEATPLNMDFDTPASITVVHDSILIFERTAIGESEARIFIEEAETFTVEYLTNKALVEPYPSFTEFMTDKDFVVED